MRQEQLFGSFNCVAAGLMPALKSTMRTCLDDTGLSREQVLDRMNKIAQAAGVRLTAGNSKSLGMATFEKWLNPADRDHLPGILALNVFCRAVDNVAPLSVQIQLHGYEVMGPDDRFARDYGRACLAERDARRKKRQMEAAI